LSPLSAQGVLQRNLRTAAVRSNVFGQGHSPVAVGPDPIRIRDRLAAHLERLVPRTRWCVRHNLHQNGVFVLRAAGVDIERLLQTVAVESQSGGLRVYGGRQGRPGVR